MPSLKHDLVIEEIIALLKEKGYHVNRIDKRKYPDAVFSKSEIYALEIQTDTDTVLRKIKSLSRSDFQKMLIITKQKSEETILRQKIRRRGFQLIKRHLKNPEIQEKLFLEFNKVIPDSTISTWKKNFYSI